MTDINEVSPSTDVLSTNILAHKHTQGGSREGKGRDGLPHGATGNSSFLKISLPRFFLLF